MFVLNELVDFCFSGGVKKLVRVCSRSAFWTDAAHQHAFTKDSIKQALHYLMHNCFFSVGNLLFRQAIGIPMGSDPAPFMANLFLFYYENKFIKSLKVSNTAKARKFSYVFRFIDDLNSINNYDEFEIDPELLARRKKQVETFKKTEDYQVYAESIQKKMRTAKMPRTPERKRRFSRRQWDGAVKQWKLKVHAESRRVMEAKVNSVQDKEVVQEHPGEDKLMVADVNNVITI